ncbi:Multidrug resistance protein mdtK [Dorcoceras hygrometricum]|nr:Multidrug resistance protein mdtK [Dorcoceras hygrometricum]
MCAKMDQLEQLNQLVHEDGSSGEKIKFTAGEGQIRPATVIFAKGAAGPAGTLKDQARPDDEERPAGARRRQSADEKMNQPLRRQISWNCTIYRGKKNREKKQSTTIREERITSVDC